MFEKILILYDISESSKQALAWGLGLGEHFHCDVKVLHIISPDLIRKGPEGTSLFEGMIREIRREIDKDVRALPGHERLKSLKTEIQIGKPVPQGLAVIHNESPDLVVVGTHGRTGLSHVLLGSVAEKIVRHSPVPVLAARGHPRWPLKKFLFPVDLAETSEEAMAYAAELSQMVGLHIDLVYIRSFPYIIPYSLEGLPMADPRELEKEIQGKLREIRAKHPSLPITSHVEEGPAAHKICAKAKELESDLILIPTHGRAGIPHLFLGSVTEHVVRYASCPVLTFCPEKAVRIRREFLDHVVPDLEYMELGAGD
jgi:nucleotide-binding universal stress UspA family protein